MDPGVVPQEAVGAVLDHGAQVDGVHHLHVGILVYNGPDGGENGLHGGAIVLPPVAGQGDHLFSREIQVVQGFVCKNKIRLHRGLHGVNDRVAGDENLSLDGLPP